MASGNVKDIARRGSRKRSVKRLISCFARSHLIFIKLLARVYVRDFVDRSLGDVQNNVMITKHEVLYRLPIK